MRIAYLCKRRYMGKDVVRDRYARLYEIPRQLARRGHQIEAWCLGYDRGFPIDETHEASPGSLRWHVRSWGHLAVPSLVAYPRRQLRALRAFAPDVVIAASDIPHIVLGAWVARNLGKPFVADLYDNFEGFGQARIPGMIGALRRAVGAADMVLTTSEPLRELVMGEYAAKGEVIAMPSTVDKSVFHPRNRRECRTSLGLPLDLPLIGTAGGLNPGKGIEILLGAWGVLSRRRPDAQLVLAGPHDPRLPLRIGGRVHYLGALPHDRVAQLFGALDVGAICINDTPFGRYCFPQKAYEMLACGLPVVAADVGAMGRLLGPWRDRCLYPPGDVEALSNQLESQLESPWIVDVPIDDWETILTRVERRLVTLA